jgi:hypothetical protein
MSDPIDTWADACERARDHVLDTYTRDPSAAGEAGIYMATELRAVAHYLAGIGCRACGGAGERTYSDTSTWRGGVGGQQMTVGICDRCWGTGRTDRTGPNLRKISHMRYALAKALSMLPSNATAARKILRDELDQLEAAP